MAAFNLLINNVAERFGMGGKAAPLFSGLLSLITDQQTGGIPGFIDRFERAGLGHQVDSWISGGANAAITSNQIESALGSETIARLAYRVGLPHSVASAALALMTPEVIDYLTPDSLIPWSLPAGLRPYLSGAPKTSPAVAVPGGPIFRKVLPIVTLVLGGFLSYHYCGSVPPLAQSTAMLPAATATASLINSTLSLSNVEGKIDFSGVVPDETTKQAIRDQLRSNFGEGNLSGNITIDTQAKPFTWLGNLGVALGDFKVPGAKLSFDGDAIKVGGSIPAAAKTELVEKLKSTLGKSARIEAAGFKD